MAPLRNVLATAPEEALTTTLVAVCGLVFTVAICACCRSRKEKKHSEDDAKIENKSKANEPNRKGCVSAPIILALPIPPREPIMASQLSGCSFTFGLNVYSWSRSIHTRKTVLSFPSAMQVALLPYFGASKGMTRDQLQTAVYPSVSDSDIDTLTTAIAPSAVNGIDGGDCGWRVATRLYDSKQRMETYNSEYRQKFEALNERAGKVMEMVGFDEADKKKPGPIADDLNAWAKNVVNFMQRPLFNNAEKKMKTFFLRKPDPRLVLVNVCGFRCQFSHPFHSINTSPIGHPFLTHDGRKLIPNVPMLHTSEEDEAQVHYYYIEDENFQCLRLPLKHGSNSGTELAVYLLLPKERGALRTLEKNFASEFITGMITRCIQPEHVRIVIPKLSLEFGVKDFQEGIKSFGAGLLFDPERAEITFAEEKPDDGAAKMSTTKGSGALKKGLLAKGKNPKGKKAASHAFNPSVTDVIHAGCFQLMDEESGNLPTIKEASNTVAPSVSSEETTGQRGSHRECVETTANKDTSLLSKTAKSPSGKSDAASSSTKPSIFSRFSFKRKSKKDGSEKSDKSGSSGSERKKSRGSDKKMSSKASGGGTEKACPVCTRIESRGVHPQLKRFVADHPFVFIVAVEKPVLVPLVFGRYCGQNP